MDDPSDVKFAQVAEALNGLATSQAAMATLAEMQQDNERLKIERLKTLQAGINTLWIWVGSLACLVFALLGITLAQQMQINDLKQTEKSFAEPVRQRHLL